MARKELPRLPGREPPESRQRSEGYAPPAGAYWSPYPPHGRPPASRAWIFFSGMLTAFGLTAFVFAAYVIVGNLDTGFYPDNGLNQDLPRNLDYSSVEEIYDLMRRQYDGDLDEQALLAGLKRGLVEAAGDQNSIYYDPDEASSVLAILNNEGIVGIGVILTEEEDDHFVITEVIAGGPADGAGLLPRDRIVKVDGVSTFGLDLFQVVARIKGEEGEKVVVSVHRDGAGGGYEELEFTIARQLIYIPTVSWEITEDNIGILTLKGFVADQSEDGEQTDMLVGQAAEDFRDAGVAGVVLDLRGNRGGYLAAVPGVAGAWIEEGKRVVSIKSADPPDGRGQQARHTYFAGGGKQPPLADLPLVVLIDGQTASASEILAGALDDYGLGVFVGQTTYGKTSVQDLYNFDDGGLLKLTNAHWYTPQGVVLSEGFDPDVEIEDDPATETDEQMEKALEVLYEQI